MKPARTVSRRAVLIGGGASIAAAATAGTWFALRGGDGPSPVAQPSRTATPTSGANATPSATATPNGPRGGVARVVAGGSFNFDTFDAQRTGEVSVAEVLGRTHSRLVTWTDFPNAVVAGDLATGWERPDATTWTFHLDPAARWQERDPLNGRAVTADDVVKHLQRMLELASAGGLPMAQRASDYTGIRRVSAPDARTVVVETAQPDPFLMDTLAGRFALVQAPEAVAAFGDSWSQQKPEQVVGSGPFTFGGSVDGVLKFAAWGGGHSRPLVDAIEVSQPGRDVEAFERRAIDEFLARDRRDTAAVRGTKNAAIIELRRFEDSPVVSSFSVDGAPWNNPALLAAISAALNRGALADALFAGRADACGPVSPATPGFALSETQLGTVVGYRADAKADAADARAQWAAAGGPALGTIIVEFPSIFDPLYSASTVVTGLLNGVLGDQFRPAIDTYTSISQKVADGKYGNGRAAFWFGWGPPLRSPDPTREFVQTFDRRVNGTGGASSQPAALTDLYDRLLTEMTGTARAELVKNAESQLIAGGSSVVPWLLQRSELFRWSYLKRGASTPFWAQHLDSAMTVDAARRASS